MNNTLQKNIKTFLNDLETITKNFETMEEKRKQFVKDFSIEKIKEMSLDEYVIGKGNNNSFCYRIENKLKDLGDIHGSTAIKFGIYYGKKGKDKNSMYRYKKEFQNANEAFKNTKSEILKLLEAGKNKNIDVIRKIKLSTIFCGKILATYYPEIYLPIFADSHLNYFCEMLDIKYKKKDKAIDKQIKLLVWKNNNNCLKNLNNYFFEVFLYETFGRPCTDVDIEIIEDEKITDYISNKKNLKYREVEHKEPEEITIKTKRTFKREPQISINAICNANFSCEIDNNHETFIKRKTDQNYTEPHHLIPMAFQGEFEKNLDVEANIVSLCSNCHNCIHYGREAETLITRLYNERKEALDKAGIKIELIKLLEMYKL